MYVSYRHPSVVVGTSALPPEDRLLRFLVDNSTDSVVQCANCDMECKAQVHEKIWIHLFSGISSNSTSFWLNVHVHRMLEWCITVTPAANHCVESAESSHTKPGCFPSMILCPWPNAPKNGTPSAVSLFLHIPLMCKVRLNSDVSHFLISTQLYIMFSTEKKSMLCIKCFRDMPK